MEFLDIDATFGKTEVPYSDAKFWTVDMASDYGVTSLTADGLHDFFTVLKDQDESKTLDYLVSKLGFNPSDETQKEQGMAILAKKDLITATKHHVGEFLCLMHHSSDPVDYKNCTDDANEISYFLQ